MNPMVASYVIIMIIAALLCMVIVVYVWPQRRRNSETLPLILLLVGITEWICAALLGMLDQNLAHKILWAKLEYIGVLSVPLAVLVFVLHHSGYERQLTARRLVWLAAIPVLTLALVWTNEFHGLVWARYIPYLQNGLAFSNKTYGPAFWVYWGYSYLLLLAATVLTIRSMLVSARMFRWQSLLVAVGILAPWIANLLYILRINPVKNLDLTPLAFGITGLALAVGMFRWQLFDVSPVARAAVLTGMADGLIILDTQGRILDVNPAGQAILDLGLQELVGKPVEDIIASRLAPDERSRWLAERGMEIRLPSGSEIRDYELSDSLFYEKGGPPGGRIIFMHDVTERKRLEARLREAERKQVEGKLHENEQRLASIYDTVGDVIYYLAVEPDEQYRFISVNPAFSKVTGVPSDQVVGKKVSEIIPEPSLQMVLGKYRQAIDEKNIVRWEETSDYPSGRLVGEVSVAPVFEEAGVCTHLVGTVHDITERKQAEIKIRRLNRYLRAISDANQVIVRTSDETALLTGVCRCVVETGGYRFAWVGFAVQDSEHSVRPAASYGFDDGYLETTIISWAENEHGHGPTGTAVRTAKTVIAQDLSNQPEYEPWRQKALQHGYAGTIAIPLVSEGQCLGALTVYSGEPQAFDSDEVSLLEELGMDLAFGISSLRMRAARELAEQALRASEDKFKYVFDYSASGKSLTQLSGGMEVNQAFCDILGYTRDELINCKWQEITHPEDVELTQKMIDVLLSGEKETVRFTKRFLHKNGSIVWGDIGSALRRDQASRPLYLMTTVTDITERKRAEELLRSAGAYNRSLLEASLDPLVTIGPDGKIMDVNKATEAVTGAARAQLIGDDFLNYFTDPQKAKAGYQKVLADGLVRDYPLTIRHASGKTTDVLYNAAIYRNEAGELEGIFAAARDITERKQAEELLRETSDRLAHMLANSPTVIYALKVAGDQATSMWISENVETVLGFRPEQAMQPTWWLEQVHLSDRPAVQASLERLFDDYYQHEYRFLCKDGRTIWLHDEHRLLRDDKNMPREIIGAWTDITDRKQAEEALRDYNARLASEVEARTRELSEAQEKLVRQEKLAVLGQLAGSVGHELRTPLAVINNAVYYLKLVQPDADAKIRQYHAMIEHEVHNGEKIIADLLDFARLKSVEREPADVPGLVQRVLERFPAPESVATVLEFPAGLPQIYADPHQMEQVLGNLVVNAGQAMKAGGTLTISAQPAALSNGQPAVSIHVKDSGTGITPENMHKLFEPLFTTKPKGIGLGLAVSRKLVEANGGRIEVQSEVGKGSTFTLYLPVTP
jgi:PAS domain S-box-containing protein